MLKVNKRWCPCDVCTHRVCSMYNRYEQMWPGGGGRSSSNVRVMSLWWCLPDGSSGGQFVVWVPLMICWIYSCSAGHRGPPVAHSPVLGMCWVDRGIRSWDTGVVPVVFLLLTSWHISLLWQHWNVEPHIHLPIVCSSAWLMPCICLGDISKKTLSNMS